MSSESRRGQQSTMYRLAARSTLDMLEPREFTPSIEEARDAYILSMLRMLEMYRYDALDRRTPAGVLFTGEFNVPLVPQEPASAPSLKSALDVARTKAFGKNVAMAQAVDLISDYLMIARGQRSAPKSEIGTKVRKFLSTLADSPFTA